MPRIARRLLGTDISSQQVQLAAAQLRSHGIEDLAQITLVSDGASVYKCTSDDKIIDFVKGGQGVFDVAIGRVWREVKETLGEFPVEWVEEANAVVVEDELTKRRAAEKHKA